MIWTVTTLVVLFIAAWVAVYFIWLRPKLKQFKLFAGVYNVVENFELTIGQKISLAFKGAKVAILSFFVSMTPVLSAIVARADGFDFTSLSTMSKTGVIFAAVNIIVTPIIQAVLHQGAIAQAAASAPADTAPPAVAAQNLGFTKVTPQ